jgi:arsenate reductase (glutaredoxin)
MLKIYHNPRCKKSCEGLKYLQNKKVDFEIVKYIEKGLTREELREILLKLNLKPHEIIRKQEDYYKKELKGKKFNDDEWLKIIIENPKLLQRPIVVGKYKAVIAQPPELAELVIK